MDVDENPGRGVDPFQPGFPAWEHQRVHALTVDHGDTALSVKSLAAANDTSIAAIGGQNAFEIYGGTVLARGIADEPDNWTEFAVFV